MAITYLNAEFAYGLAADIPATPPAGKSTVAFFATDTNTFYVWQGTAWTAMQWSAGVVTTLGSNLSLASGTLSTSGLSQAQVLARMEFVL